MLQVLFALQHNQMTGS